VAKQIAGLYPEKIFALGKPFKIELRIGSGARPAGIESLEVIMEPDRQLGIERKREPETDVMLVMGNLYVNVVQGQQLIAAPVGRMADHSQVGFHVPDE